MFITFGNFGASGSQMWYWGQHAKVCNAMRSGDIKAAIEAATALSDLGISGKKYDEVASDATLLKVFKAAYNGFSGKMPSYDSDAISRGNMLLDKAIIDSSTAGQGPTISPAEEQQILQQTLPIIAPEPSFLSRNKTPILLGGTVLILGIIGMVVLVKI